MTSKPDSGLSVHSGKPVVPPGLRISVFIDYVKLVLRFKHELQKASITKHLPEAWEPFAKVNIAAHMPGAKSSASNTCDCYTLTFHEPHKHHICATQLTLLLDAIGAILDRGTSSMEWGIDFYPTKDAPFNRTQFGQLGKSITQCLNIQGIELALNPAAATSRNKHGNKRTTDMAHDLATGWTVYIGEQPDFKDANNQHRWRDCIGFKSYYKVTDRGQALPDSQHRLRLEFTASAAHCPVDVTELLLNSKHAKKKLAQYFHLDLESPELLHLMQNFRRTHSAGLPASTIEKARKQHKRPLDVHYSEAGESCSVKYHKDDPVKPGKRRACTADYSWNDRITKAFERLTTGREVAP